MTELPKIFVGTMHMHEGDFQKCMEAVHAQEGVTVTHHIISDMKEKEAHNALWKAWRDAKEGNDLFVKIDADTVLRSSTTLSEIARLFRENDRVTGLQAPLHDYMTDSLINGLNVFSKKVTFNDTQDELYCDRQVDTDHDVVLRQGMLPYALIPAGQHCHHATITQAFHFGLHRMLKGQTDTINKVERAWMTSKDQIRAYALIGAQLSSQFMQNRKFNYADDEFIQAFKRVDEYYEYWVQLIEQGRKDEIK